MTVCRIPAMRLLLIGPPGVGKGTYAQRLAQATGAMHISSGDLLRAEVASGSARGHDIAELINAGKMVDDKLMTDAISHALKVERHPEGGYMLDGFPRNLPQAKAVEGVIPFDYVLNFRQPRSVIVKKLSSRRVCPSCGMIYNVEAIDEAGIKMDPLLPKVANKCDRCSHFGLVTRDDDKAETVRGRLELYDEITAPLEEYYAKQDKLVHFDVLGGAKEYVPKLVDMLRDLDVKR